MLTVLQKGNFVFDFDISGGFVVVLILGISVKSVSLIKNFIKCVLVTFIK